ncbi:MAG: hypothetical protein E7678_00645 [Ruminococcaceae bacterium]|nr:hypothetical protein [Oscillospiraceae bacterium]
MKDKKKKRAILENKDLATEEDSVVECGKKDSAEKKIDKKKLVYLFSTIGLSAFLCAFYYCSMEISSRNPDLYYFFPIVMFGYMAALTVLMFIYIIYNRGFSRKGITVDMLPMEWSEERKTEFVESGKIRLRRSKWLLVLIISFLFTFVAEAFALFVLPMFKSFIS